MKQLFFTIFLLCSVLGLKAQTNDSIWSGNYDGVNYLEHYLDVRNPKIDSLDTEDSLKIVQFTIYGDSLLPNYLLGFKNLKRLEIRNSGEIKNIDILSELSHLEELVIGNSIIYKLPHGMFSLKILIINDRRFDGEVRYRIDLTGLKEMKNLEYFELLHSRLNTIPKELSKLSHLKGLNLQGNRILDYTELTNLTQLEVLKVSVGHFKRELPNELIYLQNLRVLNLGLLFKRKLKYEVLYEMPNLERLIVWSMDKDQAYEKFKGIIKLRNKRPDLLIGE